MKKIYHLSTCDTCKRILHELNPSSAFILQDIKAEAITPTQIEEMQHLAGSYEALFSKRAKLYKEMGLKDQNLSEKDFKHYILEHYTFLSRPVLVYDTKIFIGNRAKTVEAAKAFIHSHE